MFINQILTKLKSLVYSKSETDSLLNGKASSSHTHTKSQITDFPSYGNTAGTICQGNDSRLSDARTPYFANNTWYAVGDDAAIGDHNVGGGLGVKALNSTTTRIDLCYKDNADNFKSITYDGTTLYMNGNCDYATNANYANSAGSVAWSNVSGKPTIPTNTNQLTNGAGFITSSGSCNYANSSGNADTLDGYHHDSFPKTFAALFTVNGLGTPGWSSIGTGEGGSCIQVKTTDNTYPSICFHRSGYSHCVLAESGGQLGTIQQGGSFNHLITSANIGSQSVNYANSAGNSDTLDGYHEYSFLRNRGSTSTSGEGTLWAQIGIKQYNNALPDGLSGLYNWGEVVSFPGTDCRFDIYCSHNSSNGNGLYYRSGWGDDKKNWRLFIDSANIGSQSVNYANSAGSAGSVAWSNVSGRPWALSQFTNDSGYITSAIKESNYSNNEKYCLLYGNLLIQFGTSVFTARSGNITFKKSFSSAPIVVVNYGDDAGFSSPCCLDEAYKTYFTVTQYTDSGAWRVNWIAIGTC